MACCGSSRKEKSLEALPHAHNLRKTLTSEHRLVSLKLITPIATMITASSRTLLRRSAPHLRTTLQSPKVLLGSFSCDITDRISNIPRNAVTGSNHPPRYLSTSIRGTVSDGVPTDHEIIRKSANSMTKRLRVLDVDVLENIKKELQSVDANHDGR
jgi:hypothetical protein